MLLSRRRDVARPVAREAVVIIAEPRGPGALAALVAARQRSNPTARPRRKPSGQGCRTDKLNSILSVGYLAHTVPRVSQVHLTSGWSLFWREMRKFGNALRHQPNRPAQIAVLQFMRATCVPPGSKWAYFLTLEEELQAGANPLLVVEPSDEGS